MNNQQKTYSTIISESYHCSSEKPQAGKLQRTVIRETKGGYNFDAFKDAYPTRNMTSKKIRYVQK